MNSFGTVFRVSIFGESHGPAIGVTVDGVPAGIELSAEDMLHDLARRRSGKPGTTPRKEEDIPEILSGIFRGYTTGAPLTVITRNRDVDSSAYTGFSDIPRPGHADYTSELKYKGFTDHRGSGHFSGRITWGLVAAGVIAKKILSPARVNASLVMAGGSEDIDAAVAKAMAEHDSIGGIIECRTTGISAGLGEPFFNSVESVISHAVFSVPAVKGIEFGAGFAAAKMKGSEHNDSFIAPDGKTATNNAGGINGGITNGNEIIFRVAVKPTSSVGVGQETYDFANKKMTNLKVEGRHDSCIALRIPVIVEAVTAISLADLFMTDRAVNGTRK